MKLGDILTLRKGNTIEIQDSETYRISGVQNYGKGVVVRREVKGTELTMRHYQVIEPNQLMWCKVDTKNGAFGITHPEHVGTLASPNMALADINLDKADPSFLETLFRVQSFADYITHLSSGTTNRKYLTPPELLKHVTLPDWGPDQQRAFVNKLRRIEKCGLASEITHQESLLTKLKQAILQEALQGKLTEDWRAAHPDVEPASQLLQRIQAEKARLIAEKKLRKEKPLPKITPEEIPFEIPKGWEWCRFGQAIRLMNGINFESGDFKKGTGVKCIKITNAGVGEFVETDDTLPLGFDKTYAKYRVFRGDLILALTRPYIASGLKISRCPESYDGALLNQRVAAIRPIDDLLDVDFAFLFLGSDFVLRGYQAEFESKGQQPNLKSEHVTHLRLPLPPLAEQAAIVERVEALMATCRALEAEIEHARTYAAHLLQAVLKEAFAPAHESIR
jgi:type I restriction enzyme S subunit